MKTTSLLQRSPLFASALLALATWIQPLPNAQAAGTTFQVGYSPTNNPPSIFDGVAANRPTSYLIAITSPGNFDESTRGGFTPEFFIEATNRGQDPDSVNYISVQAEAGQPSAFTQADQTISFRVTGTFPAVTVSTTYAFTLKAINWPVVPDEDGEAGQYSNGGHFISATSAPPSGGGVPPTVAITRLSAPGAAIPLATPITVSVGTEPSSLALGFTATGTDAYPITTLSAQVSYNGGRTNSVVVTPFENINLATVNATGQIPYSGPGSYLVTVFAQSSGGSASAQYLLEVRMAGPPTVAISVQPDDVNYLSGTPRPAIPFAFTGLSTLGNITALTAKLNGVDISASLNATGINTSTEASRTGNLSALANFGYNLVEVTASNQYGTSTIAQAEFTVREIPVINWPTPAAIIYGTPLSDVQRNATVAAPAGLAGTFTYAPTPTIQPVGSRTLFVTFTPADSAQYRSVDASVVLTVNRAPLAVIVDNKSKVYGAGMPILTMSYSGFVNNEGPSVLTSVPVLNTTATPASPVGPYSISASGGSAANYVLSYQNATLTVTPAPLSVIAEAKSKVYGATNALPLLTATYSGLTNGDTAATAFTTAPALSTTAVLASPVGSYPINPSGGVAPNYSLSYQSAPLTVTPAPLKIIAENKTKVYGEALPGLTAAYDGLQNGDTAEAAFSVKPTLATPATPSSPVGDHPITVTGGEARNYSLSHQAGTLSITRAALTVTAESKSMTYGGTRPDLTAVYGGLVAGDTADTAFTTKPTLATVPATSGAGSYDITAGGGLSANYTVSYIKGTLTINRAPLNVVAEAKSKVYGTANPQLTATYSTFVNGDTAATAFTTAPTLSTTAVLASSVGTYPITASGGVAANYSLSYQPALLTVTAAPLTVIAEAKSKVYGTANPPLTLTYSGLTNGDTAANAVTTAPSLSTTALLGSAVGTYPITAAGGIAPNYSLSYQSALLTVTRAALTVTADSKTMTYGGTLPALTAQYASFVAGDTIDTAFTTKPTLSTVPATSGAGVYDITAGGGVSANYTVSYNKGTLTINRAPLTVTADSKTMSVGDPVPALTFSPSGLVNGDTATSAFTVAPSLQTTATTTSPAGSYSITFFNTGTAPNYTLTNVNGTLTVKSVANIALGGTVFYDFNSNGQLDAADTGLADLQVELRSATNALLQTATTSATGGYAFNPVTAGVSYFVVVKAPSGFTPSTPTEFTVPATSADNKALNAGLALDFDAIRGLKANGNTIGYWKNNLTKAATGKPTGTQETLASLCANTNLIRGFALPVFSTDLTLTSVSPLAVTGLNQAAAILGSTSSLPTALLKKQLLASEYNYARGSYIGNSGPLTYAFLYWAEYVLSNSANYSSTYITWVKDWCDAYNNSHGATVQGPAPIGSTKIATTFSSTTLNAGSYIWFNAVVNVAGRSGRAATIEFNRSTVEFNVSGYPVTVDVPDAVIVFSSTATIATTDYDDTTDTWRTVVPVGYTGDVFLGGVGVKLTASLPGGIAPTWSGRFVSATTGLTASWQWSAAMYSLLNDVDLDLLKVKPIDGTSLNPYANYDNGGTPEAYKAYVIAGAKGSGGTNYTGTYTNLTAVPVGQP